MNTYDISRDDCNCPTNILYNKIDLYITQHTLLDYICVATSIRDLCESRDSEYTNFFDRNESLIDLIIIIIIINVAYTPRIWESDSQSRVFTEYNYNENILLNVPHKLSHIIYCVRIYLCFILVMCVIFLPTVIIRIFYWFVNIMLYFLNVWIIFIFHNVVWWYIELCSSFMIIT